MFSSKLVLFAFAVLFFACCCYCAPSPSWSQIEHLVTNEYFTFAGNVRCRDGSKIRPEATLKVMEYDAITDDILYQTRLYNISRNPYKAWWNARFEVTEEWFDFWFGIVTAEVYYLFENVCGKGQEVIMKPVVDGHETNEYIL